MNNPNCCRLSAFSIAGTEKLALESVKITENPWPNSFARIGLIVLLMAAPLVFGAVQPWAWGAMTVVAACLLLLWAVGCVHAGTVTLMWSPMYIPALAVVALAAVQLRLGLTMDRTGTREAIIKLVTCIAIFFLTQHLFGKVSSRDGSSFDNRFIRSTPDRQRLTTTVGSGNRKAEIAALAITVYAFLMSVFAIIQFFATPGLVYGVVKPRWGGYVFGPYVSHNAYAGLMEMLIPISVAYVLSLTVAPVLPSLDKFSVTGKLETGNWKLGALLFAILICVVSVFLSGSRGGVIAMAVEFVILTVAIIRAGSRKRHPQVQTGNWKLRTGLAACCLVLIAGALFSWLDPGDIWKRWEAAAHTPELALQDRHKITLDSLHMSRHHLVHGVGMGAFETAYPTYETITSDVVIDFAHDDYAQFVAEAGILAWILAPVSIAAFMWCSWRLLTGDWRLATEPRLASSSWRLSNGWLSTAWLRLGAAIGICGIFVHSFSDFNLHIPANAAWFAFAAGLATVPLGSAP